MAKTKMFIYGQRVKAEGKEGIIREAGDKYKIKFDDGSFGFYAENQITAIVNESSLKSKFERLKSEGQIKNDQTLMTPIAAGEDPLAQPKRETDRSVGEDQNVLGKSAAHDMFAKGQKQCPKCSQYYDSSYFESDGNCKRCSEMGERTKGMESDSGSEYARLRARGMSDEEAQRRVNSTRKDIEHEGVGLGFCRRCGKRVTYGSRLCADCYKPTVDTEDDKYSSKEADNAEDIKEELERRNAEARARASHA
jgi:hypothetical protein